MKRRAVALVILSLLSSTSFCEERIAGITVNGKVFSEAEAVEVSDKDIVFPAAKWREMGVTVSDSDEKKLSSTSLGLSVSFNEQSQMYEVTIPPRLRALQSISNRRLIETNVSASPKGVMVGYDVAVERNQSKTHVFLNHDLKTNVAKGTLYHAGMWSTDRGYERGLTTWSKDLFEKGLTIQIGDVFTDSRSRGLHSHVNLGGVRLATDRALSGDVAYPVPIIGGVADTRSTAELIASGARLAHQTIEPGPYQFSNLFYRGGLNDITTTVTDSSGRQYVTTRSFYVVPSMVAKGKTEWDIELGKVRQGNIGDHYTTPAVNFQVARGLTDKWTIGGGFQATSERKNVSLTTAVTMGKAGAFSFDVAKGGEGKAYSFGYERRSKGLAFSASHSRFDEDYWQLGDERGQSTFKVKTQTTASFGVTKNRWNVGASYLASEDFQGERHNLVSLRARYDKDSANAFSAFFSKDIATGDTTAVIGWKHKFGQNMRGSAAYDKDKGLSSSLSGRMRVNEVPVQWALSSDGEQHFGQVRAQLSKAEASLIATKETVRVGLEGGLWVGEGGVIPTTRSRSSYVVAELPKQKGVVIRGPGVEVETNAKGYAVIPNASPLTQTNLYVKSDSVKLGTQLQENQINTVAPRGGGAKASFRVQSDTMRGYNVTKAGVPLKGVHKVKGANEETLAGEGGVLVLMKPQEGHVYTVSDEKSNCLITLPAPSENPLTIQSLECVP